MLLHVFELLTFDLRCLPAVTEEDVKRLIEFRASNEALFTGKRNSAKIAWRYEPACSWTHLSKRQVTEEQQKQFNLRDPGASGQDRSQHPHKVPTASVSAHVLLPVSSAPS